MKRRPMKRSPWPRATAAERVKSVAQPLKGPVRYAQPANDPVMAMPKTVPQRNRFLLDMAKGQTCLLRVPGVCNQDPRTTVACHSNWLEHGKAGARKADDHWHVWGCSACHTWLDQGRAHHQEKRRVFDGAFAWMVSIWRDIASGMQPATPRERKAVQWALDKIQQGEQPNG